MADEWWAHQKGLRQTLRTEVAVESMGHNDPLRGREPRMMNEAVAGSIVGSKSRGRLCIDSAKPAIPITPCDLVPTKAVPSCLGARKSPASREPGHRLLASTVKGAVFRGEQIKSQIISRRRVFWLAAMATALAAPATMLSTSDARAQQSDQAPAAQPAAPKTGKKTKKNKATPAPASSPPAAPKQQ
jgi:hypothetical protein